MKNEVVKKDPEFLIFKTEDEKISVDVRLEDETVSAMGNQTVKRIY